MTINGCTISAAGKILRNGSNLLTLTNGGVWSGQVAGNIKITTPTAYNLNLNSNAISFSTSGTYDLRGSTIVGTISLSNSSGGSVTVQLNPSVSVTNLGPNITLDNTVLANLTITNIKTGSDVVITQAGTSIEVLNVDSISGTSYVYPHTSSIFVDIGIFKAGYIPYYIRNYQLLSTDASLPVAQFVDRNYGSWYNKL